MDFLIKEFDRVEWEKGCGELDDCIQDENKPKETNNESECKASESLEMEMDPKESINQEKECNMNPVALENQEDPIQEQESIQKDQENDSKEQEESIPMIHLNYDLEVTSYVPQTSFKEESTDHNTKTPKVNLKRMNY